MKTMILRRTRILPVLLAAIISACSSDRTTGTPAGPADPARTSGDIAALRTVLDRPAWRSFAALSGQFGIGATSGVLGSSARLIDAAAKLPAANGAVLATALTRAITDRASATPSVPVIRPASLGVTFVYDPAQHRYVADPSRTGAPASGVRFVLYEVDETTHEPVVAHEVGYADLVDEGLARPSGVGLHLSVVAGGVTFIDYHVIADGDATHGALGVNGFVTDGITRIMLQVAASAHQTADGGEGDVNFRITVPERDFAVAAAAHGADSGEHHAGKMDMAIHSGENTVGVSMKGVDQVVDGAFTVNGHLFATVHGDGETAEVHGAGGHELTSQEREMLGGIMQLAGSVFEMFTALLGPVALTFMLVGMSG